MRGGTAPRHKRSLEFNTPLERSRQSTEKLDERDCGWLFWRVCQRGHDPALENSHVYGCGTLIPPCRRHVLTNEFGLVVGLVVGRFACLERVILHCQTR